MREQGGYIRVLGEDDWGLLNAETDRKCAPAHQQRKERAQQKFQGTPAQPAASNMGVAQLPTTKVLVEYTTIPGEWHPKNCSANRTTVEGVDNGTRSVMEGEVTNVFVAVDGAESDDKAVTHDRQESNQYRRGDWWCGS